MVKSDNAYKPSGVIMFLKDCTDGQEVEIVSIDAEKITKKRLELLGFCKGEKITVAKNSNGSVLIIVSKKLLALGRAITCGVIVK